MTLTVLYFEKMVSKGDVSFQRSATLGKFIHSRSLLLSLRVSAGVTPWMGDCFIIQIKVVYSHKKYAELIICNVISCKPVKNNDHEIIVTGVDVFF